MTIRIYLYFNVVWPYKIIPMHLVLNGIFPRDFEHIIVDSGVNKFFKYMSLKDYPEWYLKIYPNVARRLTREYGDSVWITIPDYPDDYRHNRIPNNTELTLRNIVRFLNEYPDVNWLPVIQARWGDFHSFRDAILRYREVLKNYPRIAIGTLCTTAKQDYAVFCCRLTREYFPNSWIHVFGPNIRWLRRIAHYIDSIDSVAYYKPPRSLRGKGITDMNTYALEWLKNASRYIPPRLRPLIP